MKMNTLWKEVKNIIFYVISIPIITYLMLLYVIWSNAYVATYMIDWFVRPFYNIPEFAIWQLAGFIFVIRFLIHNINIDDNIKKEMLNKNDGYIKIFTFLIYPWASLLFAWLVKNQFFLS
jgi:hypothetical protein